MRFYQTAWIEEEKYNTLIKKHVCYYKTKEWT
jgi:hypothetical protein